MTPTLIWLACVLTTWTPSSGPVDAYHTETRELGGEWVPGPDVVSQYVVCIPGEYVPTEFRVQGFNATEEGPWSGPLLLERVHNFDGDGDGVAGFADFGRFINAFGCSYRDSGVAEGCP